MLSIGSEYRYFFDCATKESTPNDLVWEKNEGTLRFPVTTENYTNEGVPFSTRRMDLAPNNGTAAGFSDVGVYTCRDTVTGETLSINITGGIIIRNDSMCMCMH